MPFGKVADFLSELLPLSAKTTPGTIRNQMMRVGGRLQKSKEALARRQGANLANEPWLGSMADT
jgi:hypothetical protein